MKRFIYYTTPHQLSTHINTIWRYDRKQKKFSRAYICRGTPSIFSLYARYDSLEDIRRAYVPIGYASKYSRASAEALVRKFHARTR